MGNGCVHYRPARAERDRALVAEELAALRAACVTAPDDEWALLCLLDANRERRRVSGSLRSFAPSANTHVMQGPIDATT